MAKSINRRSSMVTKYVEHGKVQVDLLCNVSFQFTRIPNMHELLKLWNQLAESLDDPEHNKGHYDGRLNFSLRRTVMYFGILYQIPYSTAFMLDLIIINVLNERQDDIDIANWDKDNLCCEVHIL